MTDPREIFRNNKEAIEAWLDGKQIQWLRPHSGQWCRELSQLPSFMTNRYRPEPEPQSELWVRFCRGGNTYAESVKPREADLEHRGSEFDILRIEHLRRRPDGSAWDVVKEESQ